MSASPPFFPIGRNPKTALACSFVFCVLAFAWWRFSENTADNDLWGHVLYGQRMIHLGALETTETLSWTAHGAPWINHEVLAEIAVGAVHQFAGGRGLWLLMLLLAALTLIGAWRLGAGTQARQRLVAMALLALLTNPIALGYAMRPQLFTYLFFVGLLAALRALMQGRTHPLWTIPALLAIWVNTHAGFFAGWAIVLGAVATEASLGAFPALARRVGFIPHPVSRVRLIGVAALATTMLAANPWGWRLVLWTYDTLRLPRPTLSEWHATPLAWSSVPFFAAVLLGALAWKFTRRPRAGWELAVWLLLVVMAVRHQRHAPLFGLASLAFLPPHVTDLVARLAPSLPGIRQLFGKKSACLGLAAACALLGGAALAASLASSRAPLFRMIVPRDLYPVAAIEFIRTRGLTGNTLTFFDWGQHVLWELPQNPVSFDGRLDTVYPAEIMDAHWALYAGRDPGPALALARAELALLPTGSPSVDVLKRHGWHETYLDPLASVLTPRRPSQPPVIAGTEALVGSVAFPDHPSMLAATP